ncbi:MAG: type transport system ATP-binding protein [Verrucomicrobiaceae bacterium]|nr:type transport system ATP-binding protein [Verrucomicrobiaceae bacterium]
MSDAAVVIENLTKVFKRGVGQKLFTAVRNVSFSVKAGEVYGLIGPNGSGKSTIMKVLLGLLAPTEGKTRIFGMDSRVVESRHAVGFLPENPYFYKHLTGLETVLFFGRLCGMSGKKLHDQAHELLKLTGLENAADRRLAGYSKGMLQRIGLAQALVHEPRLLVLDEPTAGVDPAGSRRIRDLILDCKARGITVLVTSHLLEQLQEVCDRIGIMSQGRMVNEGPIEELIAVENQTELVLEDATPELLQQIRDLIGRSPQNGRLISMGHPHTTLERMFLKVTSEDPGLEDSRNKT